MRIRLTKQAKVSSQSPGVSKMCLDLIRSGREHSTERTAQREQQNLRRLVCGTEKKAL